MNNLGRGLIMGLILMMASGAGAQDNPAAASADSILAFSAADSTRGSTVYLPVLGYTPDTGIMLGAAMLKFFYLDPPGKDTRPSVFSPTFIYTLKNQIMVFMGTDLNWGGGRNHAGLFPSYLKFPNQFYGIGRESSLENEEDYTPEQIAVKAAYDYRIWRNLRVGGTYLFLRHRLTQVQPGGELDSGQVVGVQNSTVSGPGLSVAWDTRDHTWEPTRGVWLQLKSIWAVPGLGSDYDYNEYGADLRGYRSLGRNTVLAGQFLWTRLEHDVPFFVLPQLGGENGLRGYRGSLYVDNMRALGRLELRQDHIWWRVGGVVFAGIGDVAPSPDKLTFAADLWTAGFGLRYTLDQEENVKVRVDFGWGNGDTGFYLSLGEAF